jgi:predicted nuclease of predicted toxin-antitoxin system
VRLKLDENLGQRGADLLRRAGHDVATVAEQELRSSPDARLIDICRGEGRCLVTLDLEFGNPLLFKPSRYAGLAVFRLPSKPTPEHRRILFETLIAGLAEAQVSGHLWIIEIGRIRKYQEEE